MSAKQKKTLARVVISAALLALTEIAARLFQLPQAARLVLLAAAYATIGWDVLWKAIRNIGHGQVFDENFLMSVATVGAFAVGEYPEGVAVMLFYQIGELFQSFAVGRSRESIAALMNISPDYANLVGDDGSDEKVDPDDVEVGSVILVRPGEKIPPRRRGRRGGELARHGGADRRIAPEERRGGRLRGERMREHERAA
jgi:Cd2+/Zn2+-exporting ATPase